MEYKIRLNPTQKNRPYLSIDEEKPYWHLVELNSCDPGYILEEVLPGLKKVLVGKLNSYEFGFDSSIIDFTRDNTIISYGFFEGKIEVDSKDIYRLIDDWATHIKKWKEGL